MGRERGREGVELGLRFLEGGSAIVGDLIMFKEVCRGPSENTLEYQSFCRLMLRVEAEYQLGFSNEFGRVSHLLLGNHSIHTAIARQTLTARLMVTLQTS